MEFNDLEIFCKVADTQSMSAAAEQLGYVQSNVTARIRRLEEELQTSLFQRTPRGVILLPAGERLLQYARSIIELVQQAKHEFVPATSVQLAAPLRLGATSTITTGYLAEAIWDKEMELDVYTRPIQQLISMLLHDQLDGILLNRHWRDEEQVICIFQIHEPIGWMYPIAVRRASGDELAEQLYQLPILIIRDNDCPYRQATMQYISNYPQYDWNIREVDTLDMMLTLIQQGKGAAIVPKTIARHTEHQQPTQWSQPSAKEMPLHVKIRYYEKKRTSTIGASAPLTPHSMISSNAIVHSNPNSSLKSNSNASSNATKHPSSYRNEQHERQMEALQRLMTSSLK